MGGPTTGTSEDCVCKVLQLKFLQPCDHGIVSLGYSEVMNKERLCEIPCTSVGLASAPECPLGFQCELEIGGLISNDWELTNAIHLAC